MTFLNSLTNNSKEHNEPFKHWELNEPLSNEAISEIINADIPNVAEHNLTYDGTRAIDGGAPEFREGIACLLYTSPSPRDRQKSRMPSSA